ncbi:MAG: hypothetical protein PHG36_04975, partial [Dehalococcoidia bacterium]|nr:hypothetical protein [Dehalococcoidia bacterium]
METSPTATITFEARASDTPFAMDNNTIPWIYIGVSGSGILPKGRYIQWRATLTSDYGFDSPILHRVTVQFRFTPQVTTQAADNLTHSSATLNMSYDLRDYSTADVRLAYKKSSDSTWTQTSWVSKSASGTHAEWISGLTSNTQYDVKAKLKYDSTTIEGDTLQFTTEKIPPTVSTDYGSATSSSKASLRLSYTLGEYSTADVRFAYKKSADPGWSYTSWVTDPKPPGTPYFETISGLTADTQYDFKAELRYDSTMIEGNTRQFTTDQTEPTCTAIAADNITLNSANLNMSYTIGGYDTVRVHFVYSTSTSGPWTDTSWVDKTESGTYIETITGLTSSMTYYFRAELRYESTVRQSSILQFTTLELPTVTTDAATGIGGDSAILNMTYTVGDYAPVDVRFAYKKSADPGWTETPWISKLLDGTHAEPLTGLAPITQYDFKARLKYNSSEIEGATRQFATGTIPPTVITNQAGTVTSSSAVLNGRLTSLGTAAMVNASFRWGTERGGPYPNTTPPQSLNTIVSFWSILGGLAPDTTYYFTAVADGGIHGIANGNEQSFTTQPPSQQNTTHSNTNTHGSGQSPSVTASPVSLSNVIVQSASLSASSVIPGSPVEVSVNVINRGTANGSAAIKLYINGEVE